MSFRSSFVSSLLGVWLALISPVLSWSQAPDGTTYDGNHDAGGPVHFIVSPDGSHIQHLEIEGLAGGGCSWGPIDLGNWGGTIEITGNGFDATNPDGDRIEGTFAGPHIVEGTVLVKDPVKGCETPPLRWVAVAPVPAQTP